MYKDDQGSWYHLNFLKKRLDYSYHGLTRRVLLVFVGRSSRSLLSWSDEAISSSGLLLLCS